MSIIEINNVSKTFDAKKSNIHALQNITLSVEEGEIFGVIGLSGAGKSTLVRCMNLLEKPTEGEVIVDGKNLVALPAKELRLMRREIGMIFQHFNLLMQRNVLDNVCFPMEIAGVRKREAREKAKKYLDIVGLSEKAKAYPVQLSGGQKQRVAIARTLASNPRIILCDEATSALDPQTTGTILSLLKQINKDYGITVVVITHEMRVVEEICDRVAVLDHGKLAEIGPVKEVFDNPKTNAAKSLLLERKIRELEDVADGI
ncbi:MAG: ATP-binding cassette domain-containing protein [Lachnospiraceae bacterium]|nr:ATP-binding cassette domain-containing protein [Lachnospiraceae bacterium]